MTYQQAINELKQISQKIENESLELDQIQEMLSRADDLTKICKSFLKEVSKKLDDFQENQILG